MVAIPRLMVWVPAANPFSPPPVLPTAFIPKKNSCVHFILGRIRRPFFGVGPSLKKVMTNCLSPAHAGTEGTLRVDWKHLESDPVAILTNRKTRAGWE